jgi:pimeloyl-ACP methyl ester carboxylesterase
MSTENCRCTLAASAMVGLVLFASGQTVRAGGEILREVVFEGYSELSSSAELSRRLFSPFAAAQLTQEIARTGKHVIEQSINLAEEKFIVYVPSPTPAQGFALLVFVPPWQDARLPPGWAGVLDRYGVIFVSAARSGNDASVFDRREPLALLAAHNIVQHYPVDPARVYIGGFSGGARVALRLALAYPDLFHGAVLNGGSDPIGDSQIPIPRKDLFLRFQSTHVVYVTGERDTSQLNNDLASMHSLKKWCVFDVQSHSERSAGHEVAGPTALAWALGNLKQDTPPDPKKLAACREAIEQELNLKLHQVQSLIAAGQNDGAQRMLIKIDEHYGGLAAPRSIELAR